MRFFLIILLFASQACLAKVEGNSSQRTDPDSTKTPGKPATLHLEFSAKIGGGIIFKPYIREKNDPYLEFEDHSNKGYQNTFGLQATLTGKRNFALVLEPSFVNSSQHLKYISGEYAHSGGYSDIYDYTMKLQKVSISLMTKNFIGKKHILYFNFGGAVGFETAKIVSGNMKVNDTYGAYSNYSLNYSHHPLKLYNQSEILAGIGCNKFLKNGNTLSVDVRGTIHRVISFNEFPMRFPGLELSVGYTFFSSKGKTIYQNP